MISIIAVIGKNRELGKDNKLLWHIPGDLPRFKQITSGHPVIMGRRTFESIGRPLPGRTNIIITTDTSFFHEGTFVVHTIVEAFSKAKTAEGNEEIFVIGGGKTYTQAISFADRLYLTIVDAEAEADTYFPDYSQFKNSIQTEQHTEGGFTFTYTTLQK